MKPSLKGKWVNLVLPVVWLVACYFIGQHVNMPGRSTPLGAGQAAEAAKDVPQWHVVFHDAQVVDAEQIPWGKTAGEIELGDGTAAWLLTPETSMTIKGAGVVAYSIHPWMAQTSDGALMLAKDDMGEQTWTLDVTAEWNQLTLDEGTYEFSVAKMANADGDWVILRAVSADEERDN